MKNHSTKLSARELEVLQLIADGHTDDVIAIRLNVTRHTANAHRKKLLSKIECKNVAHLIATAMRMKLIN